MHVCVCVRVSMLLQTTKFTDDSILGSFEIG